MLWFLMWKPFTGTSAVFPICPKEGGFIWLFIAIERNWWVYSVINLISFTVDGWPMFPLLLWSDRRPAQLKIFHFWFSQPYHSFFFFTHLILPLSQYSTLSFPTNFRSLEKAAVSHLLSWSMHHSYSLVRVVIYLSLLPVAHCMLRKCRGMVKTFSSGPF